MKNRQLSLKYVSYLKHKKNLNNVSKPNELFDYYNTNPYNIDYNVEPSDMKNPLSEFSDIGYIGRAKRAFKFKIRKIYTSIDKYSNEINTYLTNRRWSSLINRSFIVKYKLSNRSRLFHNDK